jgi:hypothetical protein
MAGDAARRLDVLVPDPRELPAAAARPRSAGEPPTPFGDGGTAVRIIDVLASWATTSLLPNTPSTTAGRLRRR